MRFSWVLGLTLTAISFGATYAPKHRPYDVEKYSLSLSLDPNQVLTEFSAENKITLTAKEDLTSVEFDREALTTKSVEQQGAKKGTTKWQDQDGNLLKVELAKPVKAGDKITLTVAYTGKIGESHNGFFRVKDPDGPERGTLYFTNFEPLAARSFLPCNDEPYDKAQIEVTVTLPQGFDAVSNGKLVSDKKLPKKLHEVKWLQDKPHSTYLLSLAVGKFAVLTDTKKGASISVYANEKKIARAQYTMEVTRKSMDVFEDFLGTPYPWAKYATVGLPTFLWGGMENTSSTHMNEERMLLNDPKSTHERTHVAGLVAHELAHQWFGNYVTLKWWNDVWLNEAFATYMTLVAEKKIFPTEGPELAFVADTWNSYFKQEDGPRSHAIVQETIGSPEDGFDSISYTKGANVLRMLSFYLGGDERLRKALKLYLKTHGLSNATYLDFFKSVEMATGEDLKAFRDSWLLNRGYPIVTYSGTWDAKGSSYALTIKQKPNHAEDKTVFRFRMPVTFQRKTAPAYVKTLSFTTGDAERTFKFDLPAEPQSVSLNTGGVVLARIKGEGLQEKDLAAHALSNPDAITRFWAIMELGNNLEDGKPLTAFAEKTIGYVLQNDPSPYLRTTVLNTLQRSPEKNLPKALGEVIVRLAKESQTPAFETTATFKHDSLGWSEFRAALLGCLGHIGTEEATAVLEKSLNQLNLPLDDLMQSTTAVAQIGGDKALSILKTALKNHSPRGYRYQYYVQLSFASLRDKRAVEELKAILASCGPDLAGLVGRKIPSNPVVKASAEWAIFLKEFLVNDQRLGEEVKSRILGSIETEKTAEVKKTLEYVIQNGKSERIRALCKQILDKNFGSAVAKKGT